jgi:hypothetical protein
MIEFMLTHRRGEELLKERQVQLRLGALVFLLALFSSRHGGGSWGRKHKLTILHFCALRCTKR